MAGGVAASFIAKWDGNSWSALGLGMDYLVFDLVVSGSELYAGGSFTRAGDKISAYVARAYLVSPPGGIVDSVAPSPQSGSAMITLYGNPGHQFDVQRALNLTQPVSWTTLNDSPLEPASDGSFTFTDNSAPNDTAYYRAVER